VFILRFYNNLSRFIITILYNKIDSWKQYKFKLKYNYGFFLIVIIVNECTDNNLYLFIIEMKRRIIL